MALNFENLQENPDLRAKARESLRGQWGLPIGVCLVIYLIFSATSATGYGSVATIVLGGPLILGLNIFFLNLIRNKDIEFGTAFTGFNNFGIALATYVLQQIFIILWSLLFIIPGIIKAIAYSQALYILADNPEMEALEAIRVSQEMMRGAKAKYFMMSLSFIGWALLSMLTCGIGFIWLFPYMHTSFAYFYEDVKANYVDDESDSTDDQVSYEPPDTQY